MEGMLGWPEIVCKRLSLGYIIICKGKKKRKINEITFFLSQSHRVLMQYFQGMPRNQWSKMKQGDIFSFLSGSRKWLLSVAVSAIGNKDPSVIFKSQSNYIRCNCGPNLRCAGCPCRTGDCSSDYSLSEQSDISTIESAILTSTVVIQKKSTSYYANIFFK